MKKILTIIIVCVLLFTGCSKAEIESLNNLNESLSDDLAGKEDEIDELNDEIEQLNGKISDAEGFVQTLSYENTVLKQSNKELQEEVASLQEPDSSELLGSWMGNTYSNEPFSITFNIPDSWNKLNDEDLAQTIGSSIDVINELSDINIESIQDGTMIPLFYVMNKGELSSSTSNILLFMTKSLVQYDLDSIVQAAIPQWEKMFSSIGKVSFEEIKDINIGGMNMKNQKLRIDISDSEMVMYGDYYYFYIDDYLGSLAVTYLLSEESVVYDIVDTISFE